MLTPIIYSWLYHPGSSESREEKAGTCEGSKDAGLGEEIDFGLPDTVAVTCPLALRGMKNQSKLRLAF